MANKNVVTPRWGWALTGSGHFFTECLDIIRTLDHVDLFVSKAAAEELLDYLERQAQATGVVPDDRTILV
ncbi:MAG: hypothetical protein N2444_05665, partial [Methylocystis sp.]|nr:hypothetical protein [Methylocystis sp.]